MANATEEQNKAVVRRPRSTNGTANAIPSSGSELVSADQQALKAAPKKHRGRRGGRRHKRPANSVEGQALAEAQAPAVAEVSRADGQARGDASRKPRSRRKPAVVKQQETQSPSSAVTRA